LAILRFQLANALVLGGDGFANTWQPGLFGFKLAEPAPDNAFHEAHVLADLPDTQALDFDHLNDLEFKARIKASSGFLILHVLRHLSFRKNLSLCPFKLDHHHTTINATLSAKGLMLKTGTVVDATLIAAPSSTKNDKGECDPEMHQTKKGNQWHFGMKAH
jgi:hypothetical protein